MSYDILDTLLNFICKNFMVEKEEIDLEKSLVDTGIIDSIGLIEISTFIQNTFNITVNEDQMNRENFGSVVRIVKFIEKEINR